MATITTSIGTRSADNVDISSVTGSNPYTVTLASSVPSTTAIGDTLSDEAATPDDFLITGISGSDLTVIDNFGAGGAPSNAGSSQATTQRAYSTITLWAADLDDTDLYSSGDFAVGECYDDSVFNEAPQVVLGDTVGLVDITLTVAAGERHDGTQATGARIVRTATTASVIHMGPVIIDLAIEWLELDCNENNLTGQNGILWLELAGHSDQVIADWIISHGARSAADTINAILLDGGNFNDPIRLANSFAYDMLGTHSGTANVRGITKGSDSRAERSILNCSVQGIINTNGSGASTGINWVGDKAGNQLQNVISMDTGGDTSGTVVDFSVPGPTITEDHNLSSDTSAAGTGSLTEKASSDNFISTSGDGENLLLVDADADAHETAEDLGTTPAKIQFDILNFDRDTAAVLWDMGGHQFIGVATLDIDAAATVIIIANAETLINRKFSAAAENIVIANVETLVDRKLEAASINIVSANADTLIARNIDASAVNIVIANTDFAILKALNAAAVNIVIASADTLVARDINAAAVNIVIASTDTLVARTLNAAAVNIVIASTDTLVARTLNAAAVNIVIASAELATSLGATLDIDASTIVIMVANADTLVARNIDAAAVNIVIASADTLVARTLNAAAVNIVIAIAELATAISGVIDLNASTIVNIIANADTLMSRLLSAASVNVVSANIELNIIVGLEASTINVVGTSASLNVLKALNALSNNAVAANAFLALLRDLDASAINTDQGIAWIDMARSLIADSVNIVSTSAELSRSIKITALSNNIIIAEAELGIALPIPVTGACHEIMDNNLFDLVLIDNNLYTQTLTDAQC